MKPKYRTGLFRSACIVFSLVTGVAQAEVGTWTATLGTTWDSTDTNWSGLTVLPPWDATNGAVNSAVFDGTTVADATVSGTVFTNGITFTTSRSVSGGTMVTMAGTTPFISVADTQTGAIASVIGGTSGYAKQGTGKLIVSGENLYGGVTTVSAGVLSIQSAGGLGVVDGTSPNGTVVATGAALEVQGDVSISVDDGFGGTFGEPLTLNGTGVAGNGALRNVSGDNLIAGGGTYLSAGTSIQSDSGTLTLIGKFTKATGTGGILNFTGAGNITLENPLAVSGGIIDVGTSGTWNVNTIGTVTLAADNQIRGTTNLISGTVNVNSPGALGTGSPANNKLNLNGATLDNTSGAEVFSIRTTATNPTQINADFTFLGSNPLSFGTAPVTLGTVAGTSRTITVDASVLTINGNISDGSTANSIVKAGAGTLALTGVNTYSGDTTVLDGVLDLSASGLFGKSSLIVDGAGATVNLQGSTTVKAFYVGPKVPGNLLADGVYSAGHTGIPNAKLTGPGTLTVVSVATGTWAGGAVGTWNTTATNWTGVTGTPWDSTEGLTSKAVFATVGDVATVSGTVNVNSMLFNESAVVGSGEISMRGVLPGIEVADTKTGTVSSVISGDAGLVKKGPGTLVLSGANTYSGVDDGFETITGGETLIDQGILNIRDNTALGVADGTPATGTSVSSGAVLELESDITVSSEALNLASTATLRNVSGNNTYNGNIGFETNAFIEVVAGSLTLNGDLVRNGGGKTLTTTGAGDLVLNPTSMRVGTTGSWFVQSTGSVTITTSMAINGAVHLQSGTVNVNATGGLGDSSASNNTLALDGAVLDNTSGAPVESAKTTSGVISVNADLVFTGTHPLGLGGANVNLGNSVGASRTFTVSGSTLEIQGSISDGTNGITPAVNLIKDGAGTLLLSGSNLYSGSTTVSAGALAVTGNSVPDGSTLTLNITNGASVDLTGIEYVNEVVFDADPPVTDVIYTSDGKYGTTASAAFTGSGYLVVGNPALPEIYDFWILGWGLAPDERGANDDPESDGIPNLLEWVLNGDPSVSDTSKLPELEVTPADFVFTYFRNDPSYFDTIQSFEFGGDLSFGTSVTIPEGPGASMEGVATITITEGSPADTIEISIPRSSEVDGKIFGRLRAVK